MRIFSLLVLQFCFCNCGFAALKNFDAVVKVLIYPEDLIDLENGDALLARGSGFIVSTDGILFTNSDLVEWCVRGFMIVDWMAKFGSVEKEVVMTLQENNPLVKKTYRKGMATPIVQVFSNGGYNLYKANVIAFGPPYQGAALKIISNFQSEMAPLPQFPTVSLGNALHLAMNEELTFLGYPEKSNDFGSDLNQRVKSFHGQNLGQYLDAFQTNTELNDALSGGPVFDMDNKVVGIISSPNQIVPINPMCQILDKEILKSLMEIGLCHPKSQ